MVSIAVSVRPVRTLAECKYCIYQQDTSYCTVRFGRPQRPISRQLSRMIDLTFYETVAFRGVLVVQLSREIPALRRFEREYEHWQRETEGTSLVAIRFFTSHTSELRHSKRHPSRGLRRATHSWHRTFTKPTHGYARNSRSPATPRIVPSRKQPSLKLPATLSLHIHIHLHLMHLSLIVHSYHTARNKPKPTPLPLHRLQSLPSARLRECFHLRLLIARLSTKLDAAVRLAFLRVQASMPLAPGTSFDHCWRRLCYGEDKITPWIHPRAPFGM